MVEQSDEKIIIVFHEEVPPWGIKAGDLKEIYDLWLVSASLCSRCNNLMVTYSTGIMDLTVYHGITTSCFALPFSGVLHRKIVKLQGVFIVEHALRDWRTFRRRILDTAIRIYGR